MPGSASSLAGVVVGAGASGLMAALRASAGGARVALLDCAQGDRSNLVVSGGLFAAAGTRFQASEGIADSPALWSGDVRRKTDGAVDAAILDTVTGRAADAVHFLADHVGLDIHLATGLPIPGHSVTRLHATQAESGRELTHLLLDAVRRTEGIAFFPDTEADALIVLDGRVPGVRTRDGRRFLAPWTLLAIGGFAGNRSMVERFAPEVAAAVNIGLGPNDGRALEWGRALGGELLFMDSYQGQGHVTADGKGRLGPGLTSLGAIVVNARGERFADEAMGPSEFGAFVLAQPGGQAVELFDTAMDAAAMRLGPYRESVARGCVLAAPDAAALAALFDLPATTLAATLASYNEAAAANRPDPFGRTAARQPLEPPFMAARTTGALAHTQGGLRVDVSARVLRADGTTIPGLLAAGGAAAAISGHGAAGYIPGNGLAHAFALGLVAGEVMAGETIAAASVAPAFKAEGDPR
jgi:fumarate reductase flavoprotein subunit